MSGIAVQAAGRATTVPWVEPGRPGVVPPDVYVASLARKRMAAGALCCDQGGRVLLVDPVYRDTWDLPGGAVEAEESPQAACRREVAEELGLDRPVGRVLAVDWVPSRPDRPEGLVVVYDGGVITADDVEAITVPAGELLAAVLKRPAEVYRVQHHRTAGTEPIGIETLPRDIGVIDDGVERVPQGRSPDGSPQVDL